MSDQILEARGVWKIFGNATKMRHAGAMKSAELRDRGMIVGVEDANFSIRRGEIFIIMGLSGSGKSTLLRCLTGLYPASRGQIFLDETDLSKASASELLLLRRRKMGMVFQSFALLPHYCAIDNVAFPLQVAGVSKSERHRRAKDALALVGLTGLEERFPNQMSGGQQQRVGIARSLISDPTVWFLDEPFSALDPLIRRDMQDEFQRLQSQLHKTIVFVTHDLEEAVRLADRIAIMADGKILQIGTPEDIVTNPATDYVRRFVAGIPKGHVVTVRRIMSKDIPSACLTEPVPADVPIQKIMARILCSEQPLPVADNTGAVIGTISRAEVANWMQ